MAFTNLATKLLLNDKQINSGPLGNGFPFIKFAWTVEIQVGNSGEAKGINSTGPLVAKTCELPRFSVETQVVNVYNHKTIVQTKMNYEPITMTFYDQTNGTAEKLIWEFVKGQFDPSDVSKKPGNLPLTVIITLKNLSGDDDGEDKIYTLKNAYIVDAQHDTLDYSTSDPVLWTLTLRYEDLEVSGVKDLEFSGPTPGDEGSGIKALPKPPSKPVVSDLPDPPPVTKPPKSDAVKEDKVDTRSQFEIEMGIGDDGTTDGVDPTAYKDSKTIPYYATQQQPYNVQKWPESPNSSSRENNSAFDGNADDPEAQTFVKPYNASTGNASSNVQSPATAQQAADARAAYARTDPRRLDGNDGLNSKYKEAYANEYAKQTSKIPENASPALRSRLERDAAKVADMKARAAAPKYSSQVRTQNADGSVTDTYTPSQPQSVNNNTSASASQATKEQNYNSGASAKPNANTIFDAQQARKQGLTLDQYYAKQNASRSRAGKDLAAKTRNVDY